MSKVRKMSITEFREFGFLQEANRQFFHPLGIALEVVKHVPGGKEELWGIWDYRDDPEGMAFQSGQLGGELDQEKAERVAALRESKVEPRQEALGYLIQPVAGKE